MNTYYSHGKLLLTAEYLVLDGAQALALPTKKGQSLEVHSQHSSNLHWKSVLEDGSVWFETSFKLPLQESFTSQDKIIQRLHDILKAAQQLNPEFLKIDQGLNVVSTLEFAQNWGLGSSSTLISNIARWANVNAYTLLKNTFGGSGYDIACATNENAIVYSNNKNTPLVKSVNFNPDFKDQLFFVHLNRKQNSRKSIQHYRSLDPSSLKNKISYFTDLTLQIVNSNSLNHFERLLNKHEDQLSEILQTPTIKSQLFEDYSHTVKSLGGWGGDFVLTTGTPQEMEYFKDKGYNTIVSYQDMIL